MPKPPLDVALLARLREVLGNQPATEAELRALSEQLDASVRILAAQVETSEQRLRRLTNRGSALAQIAEELRRVQELRPQLNQVRRLRDQLEERARQVRTEWLLSQASRRPADRQP